MASHNTQYPADKLSSKHILIRSFAFVALAIVIMAAYWFSMITKNQQLIYEITTEHAESEVAIEMREAIQQQLVTLSHLVLEDDASSRNDEHIYLAEQIKRFTKARNLFVDNLDEQRFPEEFAIWRELKTDIAEGDQWRDRVIELILKQKTKKAHNVLHNNATPGLNRVIAQLSRLHDKQQQYITQNIKLTSQQNQSSIYTVGLFLVFAILWCVGIGAYTIRRAVTAEKLLLLARDKAQDADNKKSQFLANMSHEIRTPLTAIIGFSEALIEGEKRKKGKTQLNSIIRNSKHLHQLIDDILDLSKIEANQLNIEQVPVCASQILAEVDALMGERARSKGLRFEVTSEYPVPKQIISDPTRLKQILINLCGNAIKFTAKGKVALKLGYKKGSNQIYFDVEDSGIGMTQDQLSSLFKPFTQADSSTARKFGGTGLGLCISKQLADSLGGGLTADSLKGVGSRFTVCIDAGDISQIEWINSKEDALKIPLSLNSKTNVPALKGKILLAEDNPDNQHLISMLIKKTGAEVEVVENGKLAVAKGIDNSFDIILMDMQMPVMGGIEAISELRKAHCTTPIATLTANATKEDAHKSELAGANDFLTKPINKHAFYAVLEQYLSLDNSTKNFSPNNASYDIDLDDISDLIEKYIRQLPETIYRIEQLLSAKEWDGLKDEIHQLKGTGSAFGFPEITTQCTNIEKKILNHDVNATSQLISDLHSTCTQITHAKAS